ncbi:hypothetical protein SDC9_146518 [bioreactor metagenome]|uniref:Uncharacterized protein n=1 Tax=bioreactor metagenome TaxID=1076179 RepID=A0A645EBG8_9ZZZZ
MTPTLGSCVSVNARRPTPRTDRDEPRVLLWLKLMLPRRLVSASKSVACSRSSSSPETTEIEIGTSCRRSSPRLLRTTMESSVCAWSEGMTSVASSVAAGVVDAPASVSAACPGGEAGCRLLSSSCRSRTISALARCTSACSSESVLLSFAISCPEDISTAPVINADKGRRRG